MKGIKHGQGSEFMHLSQEIYKGSYKQDTRHGNGLSVNTMNGVIHRGEYREGKMQGQGIVYCPPGEIIEASFSDGRINDGKAKILVIIIL